MNRAHKNLIRTRYENAVHEYCKAFCEKHEYQYDPDGWVGNDVGTIIQIGDYFIDFVDIRYDIDNDVPAHKFIQWYDYSLEIAMLDEGSGNMRQVNYRHWLMGARPYSEEDFENIREAKKRVQQAQYELECCIAQHKHNKAREARDKCLSAQTDELDFIKDDSEDKN